ncbi:MAG TPA: prenyltransferase/squalene oxidase repeat-containing protein [Mycobacteriales bacterium]|nr:prenyltransferase/squalene oxidase repeat-containing protein [Mycobacteriales bacterium]
MARSRLLAVLAFLCSFLVIAAPAAQAAPTTDPADAAAGWLAGRLTDGSHFVQDFGDAGVFPDQGLTLDAVLAFAAAGSGGTNATAGMAWLAQGTTLVDYVGDGTTFSDIGALAKVAYAAEVTGGDGHSVAGIDVLGRLSAQLTASGRFSNVPAEADNSNAFGQALAQLALARTPDGVPAAAVTFLAGSQCPGGGFPLDYGQATCVPDPDATAMVVQALALPGGNAAAAGRGLDWLVSRQAADGSLDGSGPTEGVQNANSTGLAAEAFRAGGRTGPADAAVGWLRSQQLGCTGPVAQQGAIAYDGTGFDPGNADRATAQAILGLSGIGLADLSLDGATPDAPTLDCAGSPPPTATPTAIPTSSAPSTPAPSTVAPTHRPTAAPTTPVAPVLPVTPPPTEPAAAVGSLPNTGAPVLPVVWTGVGLVLVGVLAVVAGRRRREAP